MFRQLSRAVPKGVRIAPVSNMRTLGAVSQRSFQTSQKKQQAVAPAAASTPQVVGDGGLGAIVSKFGTVPFVGLGVGAMLSKEIVLFNNEFMLLGVWGAFCTVAYIQLGDTVYKYFQDQIDERAQKFDDAMDMYVAGVNVYKIKQKWQLDQVEVLEDMQRDYEEMLKVTYAAKNLQLRNAAYNSMVARLQGIHTQEELAASKANEALVEKCLASVHAEFAVGKLNAKTKASLLETAIGNIGAVTSSPKDDHVAAAFVKNLQ